MTGPVLAEWEATALRFGVAIEQVRRDHLISHVLAAISRAVSADEVIFFGGTALSRTHLTHRRLSEDIDLIAVGPRRPVAERIVATVASELARSHGEVRWSPELTATTGGNSSQLAVLDGTVIQVRLLSATGYPAWPTEVFAIEQRYSDAPSAQLRVLTADGFVAAKLTAWLNRSAPRDLYDLWAMNEAGLIGGSAAATFARHGPTGRPLDPAVFDDGVEESAWNRALEHQTRLEITARAALSTVREAWARAERAWQRPG